MTDAIVMGGGLAGIAAATAIQSQGFSVRLLEAKPFFGGRATSYPLPHAPAPAPEIDNCQHILLKCCVNLRDLYARLGVADQVDFQREFYFIEPGGRMSHLRRGLLPAPLHFTESFLAAKYLSWADKIALGRAMLAIQWERKRRTDLDQITMADWLREKKQPQQAIDRFWRQVLVSAINVELDQMAASHAFQVMWLGFMATSDSYEMGIPRIPLGRLIEHLPGAVERQPRAVVEEFSPASGVRVNGEWLTARAYVSALPADKLAAVLPELPVDFTAITPSPIVGVHLWFEHAVTALPHGTLLDRHIQWFYNKDSGRYLTLVVSAADEMLRMSPREVVDLSLRELAEFLPAVATTRLVRSHVAKEAKATFRAVPGLAAKRPTARTPIPNLFLAGDWTQSGWPSTMEGAVRSGYLAAEAATTALGKPGRFLLPDVA